MVEAILVAVGLLLGAGLGWLVTRTRGELSRRSEREALQHRLVAMETRADVLSKQLSQRELDASDLRESLRTEQAARTQAETRLEAERRAVEEQRVRDTPSSFRARAAERLRGREQAIDALVKPL